MVVNLWYFDVVCQHEAFVKIDAEVLVVVNLWYFDVVCQHEAFVKIDAEVLVVVNLWYFHTAHRDTVLLSLQWRHWRK